ncbi:MAG: response regulator [Pseudomonadota bacterium]
MIRVVIVDDQTLVRSGIASLLGMSDKVEVVGEAGDGESALYLIPQLSPDVVLMDIRMPGLSGLDVIRRLQADGEEVPRTILLTTFEDQDSLQQAIRLGAKGYLLKDVTLDNLLASLELVMAGQSVFDHRINHNARSVSAASATETSLGDAYDLTAREINILELMAEGASNKEIASRLDLKMGTVKNYVSSVLLKLGVRDRTQAVIKIKEEGWF